MYEPFNGGSEPRIVYEDEDLLGVYKPCRLHSSPLDGGGADLCTWLFAARPDLAFDSRGLRAPGAGSAAEGGLFHRLDFETSGLVLFAKTGAVLGALLEAQEGSRIRKDYIALVEPSLEGLPGSRPSRASPLGVETETWFRALDATALSRSGLDSLAALVSGREMACRFRAFGPGAARVACLGVAIPGQESEAPGPAGEGRHRRGSPGRSYSSLIIGAEEEAGALLLQLRIHRGFRHQLRAQLAWIGLPILGDSLYGPPRPGVRLHLEARSLSFDRPDGAGPLTIGLA